MVQRGTYPPDELHELEPPPISMIWIKLNLSFSLLMELDLVKAKAEVLKTSQSVRMCEQVLFSAKCSTKFNSGK
jgi:hypothetical protein